MRINSAFFVSSDKLYAAIAAACGVISVEVLSMKLDYSRRAKDPTYFIASTVRSGDKVSTVKVATIGKHSDLLKITDDPLSYAKQKVEEFNRSLKDNIVTCTAQIDLSKKLDDSEQSASQSTYVNVGYFFLQKIYSQLELNRFFSDVTADKRIGFDCDTINRFLTYARILDPRSKLGTFDKLSSYYEKPEFEYHQILRFMDVLSEHSTEYLRHLFITSNNIVKRDTSVMYYDCSNFYCESEIPDEDVIDEVTGEVIQGLRQFGVSKEHRPNPIVEMGLIMDSRGIPVSMCIHPGNTNEQTTAIPLEKELLNIIGTSKFIYCSDGGLGSYGIRKFNSMGGRAFIVTQSIKKLSDVLKEAVFNDCDYRLLSNDKPISVEYLKTFDKSDKTERSLYDDKAYKIIVADRIVDLGLTEEKTLANGKKKTVKSKATLRQRIIITYSRKMMEYERTIRNRQVERARKMVKDADPEEIKKGPNDVRRFIKRIAKGKDGSDASVRYEIDEEKIRKDEQYDGYYAVATNLEDPARDILAISAKRYQIEDCFRIMKTSFEARPIYHRKPERINAHFLICYTALLIYRLMEVQLDNENKHHTVEEIRETLKNMNITEEFNVYCKALYTGSSTLSDLVSVLGLPLDHQYYQASDLNKTIKKLLR